MQTLYKTNDKGEKVAYHKTYYSSGKLRSEFSTINGKKQGSCKSYYENGQIKNEDNYKNNELDGQCKRYQLNGDYIDINEYKKGKLYGHTQWFYESGELQSDIDYINDKRNGSVRIYDKNGVTKEFSQWKHGRINGTVFKYYEDGQLKSASEWRNGKKEGKTIAYYESGTLKAVNYYHKGSLQGYNEWYYENGKIKSSLTHKKGKKHGICKWYDIDGFLTRQVAYKNDKQEGEDIRYFGNSTIPKEIENFKNDCLNGLRQTFYHNGQVQWSQNYQDAKLKGLCQYYDIHGKLVAEFIAENEKIKTLNHFSFDDTNYGQNVLKEYEEEKFLEDLFAILFEANDYQTIEKFAKQYRKTSALQMNGDYKLSRLYTGIISGFLKDSREKLTKRIQSLEAWKKQSPQSLTVRTALIKAYKDLAWDYRGSGFANSVSEQGLKQYRYYIELAYNELNETSKIDHNDPCFYLQSLCTLRSKNIVKKNVYGWVDEGTTLYPDFYKLYQQGAFILLPRWHGVKGDTEEFAQWAYEKSKASAGPEMYARIVLLLKDIFNNELFTKVQISWDLTKKGLEELHAKYPKADTILHDYAWLSCINGERDLAKKLFAEIGTQWDTKATELWGTKENFNQWVQWAAEKEVQSFHTDLIHTNVLTMNPVAFTEFLTKESDINVQDSIGQTALHLAIKNHKRDNAKILIHQGADVNIQAANKMTPLILAAIYNEPDIAEILIGRKANINADDTYQWTALHYAANNGFLKFVSLLIQNEKVRINDTTNFYSTALHLAVRGGHAAVVNQLIQTHGMDLNVQDYNGDTPLHLAAERGYLNIAQALINKGANPNLRNKKGLKPSAVAKANQYIPMYVYLKVREH